MFYIDTSALLPFYRQEEASDAVQAFFSRQTQPVFISHLTEVEFASALSRWVRSGEMNEPDAHRIENAFREDIQNGLFQFAHLQTREYKTAMHWLTQRKTSLRTLDALHMACADSGGMVLISLDKTLLESARYFGVGAGVPENF